MVENGLPPPDHQPETSDGFGLFLCPIVEDCFIHLNTATMQNKQAQIFKLLGNPYALSVVQQLAQVPESNVNTLTKNAGCQQSQMSALLARLKDCGVVVARREGVTVHYSLNSANITAELVQDGKISLTL